MAVIVAVIAAGCGGTPGSSGTSTAAAADTDTTTTTVAHTRTASHTSTLTARQKAVKFSECLRANGVSDFPDPNASGEFPSYGVSVTRAVWTTAVAACKSLQPPGSLSAHLTQPLIDTERIPSANKPGGMTILNAATNKCGDLLAQQTTGQ
jgi:hypothetical protein